MKVLDSYTHRNVDPETGEVTFEIGTRWIEVEGILTESEGIALDKKNAIIEHNAEIQRQLDAHTTASFDDFLSGDKDKIAAIKKRRNELRAQLKS